MKHTISTLVLFTAVIITYFAVDNAAIFLLLLASYLFIFSAILIGGVSIIKWNYFIPSINKVASGQVCLTFDDGPGINTSEILDLLKKENIKAMFFVIGKHCTEHPEMLKRIHEEGHVIGNHSYMHENKLGWSSTKLLVKDIESCNAQIQHITGIAPRFYRPPFGITNPRIARAVKRTNMQSVGWSIRTYDTAIKDLNKLTNRTLKKINAQGHIILMHDHCTHTPALLSEIIQSCRSKGIDFVTLNPTAHKI